MKFKILRIKCLIWLGFKTQFLKIMRNSNLLEKFNNCLILYCTKLSKYFLYNLEKIIDYCIVK